MKKRYNSAMANVFLLNGRRWKEKGFNLGGRSFYVVVAQMNNGTWHPADFAGLPFVSLSYWQARQYRKDITARLMKQVPSVWTKERISLLRIEVE